MKEKKIKAWAIIGTTGDLIGAEQWDVYYGDGDADNALANLRRENKNADHWEVVPCTIIYTLPAKRKRK